MAQLPPKVPNMTPNWSGFPHQRIVSMENLPSNTTAAAAAAAAQNTSWVDEFLDFSMAKRGSHRRSISDSIAFVEPQMAEKSRPLAPGSGAADDEFDQLDDEQLLSMFTDDVAAPPTVSSSNTSTPSDHNSINDEKQNLIDQQQPKNDSEEVQSSCTAQAQVNTNATTENPSDKIIDPKRVKRILANRQSAQRSRVRKLQYITELERSVNSLQAEVSVLSPRVAFLDHQRLILNVDNSALKQRIAALAQDKIFKDAHQEALRREIDRLRKLYHEQSLKKMENSQGAPSSNANS